MHQVGVWKADLGWTMVLLVLCKNADAGVAGHLQLSYTPAALNEGWVHWGGMGGLGWGEVDEWARVLPEDVNQCGMCPSVGIPTTYPEQRPNIKRHVDDQTSHRYVVLDTKAHNDSSISHRRPSNH